MTHPDKEKKVDHEEWDDPTQKVKTLKALESPEEMEDKEIAQELRAIRESQTQMVQERTWKEFQEAGLLWFANRILHLFGWAVVIVQEKDGSISKVYPARVKFRGFYRDLEAQGFQKLSNYLEANIKELTKEANDVD